MPKLLIPYYAIDEQAETVSAVPAVPAPPIQDTFELRCARDCDLHNHFEWWGGLNGTAHQPIVHQYTDLANISAEMASLFGSAAIWGSYAKIDISAYVGTSTADQNYLALFDSADGSAYSRKTVGVYGDATLSTNNAYLNPTIAGKVINDGDGDVILYVSGDTGADAYHKLELVNDSGTKFDSHALYHVIDGLLVTLPSTPDHRTWEESFEGGAQSFGPSGKVHWYGYKNIHMHRGKRVFSVLFPDLSANTRISFSQDRSRRESYSTEEVLILKNCLEAGKGVLPFLYMHDETDTGTWQIVRMLSLGITEPSSSVYNAEVFFEEY